MSLKTRKTVLITSGSVAVLGLLVVVGFFLFNLWKPVPTMEEKLSETTVGANISNIVTVDGEPASTVIISPSTQQWWDKLTTYTPNPLVYGLDYKKYSEGSQYLAYTLSPGAGYTNYGTIGLPTTFIVYKDNDTAIKNAALLETDGISHQLLENMIFFVPEGALSDVNYALNQFQLAADKEDLNLDDEAVMFFGYNALYQLFTRDISDDDVTTFDTLAGMMGVTMDTFWSGHSKDGFTWDGSFTGLQVNSISSPKDIYEFLTSRWYIQDKNGELVLADEFAANNPVSEEGESKGGDLPEQSGLISTAQSTIMSTGLLSVRNNTEVGGTDVNGDTLPVLPASVGAFQAVFGDLNSFIGLMHSDDAIYPYTTFDTLVVTVKRDGSSTVQFTLNKNILGEENVNNLGDPNGENRDLLVTQSELDADAPAVESDTGVEGTDEPVE